MRWPLLFECPLTSRSDTGILTLIVASETAGLELHDKASRSWVAAESVAKPWEIVCIIGEKVPAFTRSELFPATLHRVVRATPCTLLSDSAFTPRRPRRASVTRWHSSSTLPSDVTSLTSLTLPHFYGS